LRDLVLHIYIVELQCSSYGPYIEPWQSLWCVDFTLFS